MRKPILKDVFTATKIINKMGLKEFKIDTGKSTEEIGLDTIMFFIENLPKAENEVFELLADIMEVTTEEAQHIEIDDIPQIIKGLTELDGMANFIKSVTKLTGSKPSI